MLLRLGQRLLGRRRAAIVAVALLVGLITLGADLGLSADRKLQQARAWMRDQPPSGRIVLVEIDGRSLRAYGKWPWPRRYHAALIDRVADAKAERIAFDIDFSSHSNPVDDRAMSSAIARSGGRVILAATRQREHAESSAIVDVAPIPEFARHATIGSVMTTTDSDGFVRSGSTGYIIDGKARPSLAALLAETSTGPERRFPLDTSIDLGLIKRISASDVIAGTVDPALLSGKKVVVGGTAVELGDRVLLPRNIHDPRQPRSTSGAQMAPGVYVNILGAETLMRANLPRLVGEWPALVMGFLAVFALASIRSRVAAGVVTVGTMLVLLIAPLIAEMTLGWVFYVVPAMAALFAGSLMRVMASLARSFFDSVATNELSGLPNTHALHFDAKQTQRVHVAVARIQDMSAITSVLGETQTGELLRRVSERIAFSAEDAKVYHVGDSTFAWLVRPGTEDEIPDRFDALHALLSAPIRIGTRPIDVGVTYGLCTTEPDLHVALRAATLAAERAAARGIRWHSYSSDEQDEVNWRMSLLGELDGAIDAGQLWVAYQPKYDVKSGTIVGAEALVRWLHPERGAIRPDHFVPLAEESGRIAKLTRFVLDTALGDFATLTNATHRPVVAVNLSTTLLSAPNLVEMVCDALWRNGVLPEQLILEVTESAAMTSDENALAVLERFRSMGIGISIDDYGTGQSTLNYLKRLPATELKIDQSFVRAISDSRSDEILVNSTIQLGHQLGMKVVAEGVETLDVLERLETFGCDVIQGYLIGKPVPFNEFTRGYRQAPRLDRAA